MNSLRQKIMTVLVLVAVTAMLISGATPTLVPASSMLPEIDPFIPFVLKPLPPATDQIVTVLMYHHVMPHPNNSIAISPKTFDEQMKYLSAYGFHTISMKQFQDFILTGKRLPEKPVLLTFDDGRRNQLTYAVPILKKYGFTATFFVVKKWTISNDNSFLHLTDLRQMATEGYDIQSHTTRHRYMRSFRGESYDGMKKRYGQNLAGMKNWLEHNISQESSVVALAYPGGFYDRNVMKLSRKSGYTASFGTFWGYVRYNRGNPARLPRWNTGARGLKFNTFKKIVNHTLKY